MIKKIGNGAWIGLVKLQRIFMVLTAISTILLVAVNIVLRELALRSGIVLPFFAYEEILLPVAFWMYMLGSSHGSFEKSQITADIMSKVLKGRPKAYLHLLASILTFILGVIFAYWALTLVQWGLFTGANSTFFNIPVVWGQMSILVGLILTSMYNFVYMIQDIINIIVRPQLEQKA